MNILCMFCNHTSTTLGDFSELCPNIIRGRFKVSLSHVATDRETPVCIGASVPSATRHADTVTANVSYDGDEARTGQEQSWEKLIQL